MCENYLESYSKLVSHILYLNRPSITDIVSEIYFIKRDILNFMKANDCNYSIFSDDKFDPEMTEMSHQHER